MNMQTNMVIAVSGVFIFIVVRALIAGQPAPEPMMVQAVHGQMPGRGVGSREEKGPAMRVEPVVSIAPALNWTLDRTVHTRFYVFLTDADGTPVSPPGGHDGRIRGCNAFDVIATDDSCMSHIEGLRAQMTFSRPTYQYGGQSYPAFDSWWETNPAEVYDDLPEGATAVFETWNALGYGYPVTFLYEWNDDAFHQNWECSVTTEDGSYNARSGDRLVATCEDWS